MMDIDPYESINQYNPYESIREETADELLLIENESLTERVAELEKIVSQQQAELMLLQTTSSDLMRRMAQIEATSSASCNCRCNYVKRVPTRSTSQSTYNITKFVSPSRNEMSQSLHTPDSLENCIEESPRPSTESPSTKHSSPVMYNVSVGRSPRGSPLRKWMSHQDVKGTNNISSQSIADRLSRRTTPSLQSISQNPSSYTVSRSSSRAASISSLYNSSRNPNNYGCNNRQPIFNSSTHTLQLQISGRSVNVPVPTEIENFDPATEQSAPNTPPPRLEWAYGYRGKDVRNNVHYLPTGELVYFCGSVVVLYNVGEHTQRHYTEHTSDVKCITVHPNRVIVASAQSTCHQRERRSEFELCDPILSSKDIENSLDTVHTVAHVRIWDSVRLNTLQIIGVGNLLLCIDESHQHSISIWKWSNPIKLAETKGACDQILAACWHPSIKNLIVSCGKGHLLFWVFDSRNGSLTKNSAIFEGRNKPKTVLAICFTKTGDVLTGDSNGTLSLWDPISFRAKKQAHTVHPGGIMALCVNRNENVLSAGKDRVIIEWETTDLVRRRKPTELPDDYGFPRVIINTERNTVIIGTSRNVLLVGGFEMDFIEIVNADFENVTCCVAVQPYSFITASADGEIRLHNTSSKTLEWRKNYGKGVTCITVNPTGSLLALGTCSGTWWLMDLSTKNLNFEQKESTQPITAIQFSLSGILLFVATKDLAAVVYRLDGLQRFSRIARIGSIASFIISVDWDVDSEYLRCNSAVGHIYHWSATGEFMDNAIIQDVKWATCNCRISFEVGCIAHSVEGITTICRSPSEDKVVIGRDNGSVRVYTYPVTSTSAGFHALSGHCHAVSSTVFTELNLITIGLVDNTIHQWKLQ